MKNKSNLEQRFVGTKLFPEVIDITDPCYDKNVWCRINNVKIKPGAYSCYAWMIDQGEWGSRCAIAGIYLDDVFEKTKECECFPHSLRRRSLGTIGVDAGLAGFFSNKPDYNDEEWSRFCDHIRRGDAWIIDEGFFTSTGYGDGEYDVYAVENEDGEIVALEIHYY